MLKSELIEILQSIEGDPVVLLMDTELGCTKLKDAKIDKMHQSITDPDEYVEDSEFESENGINTFYHNNYKKDTEDCIVLNI